MEIERKFLIKDLHSLPFSIEAYPHRELEQAYLCTGPVVRIRKDDEQYFLTYKSKGLMIREEYNLPLNRQAYLHLREKADGRIIQKTRYVIPLDEVTDSSPSQKESHLSPQFREKGVSLFLELDIFKGDLAPLSYTTDSSSREQPLSSSPTETIHLWTFFSSSWASSA